MALPPRVYYTLQEASIRWDCSLADIAGWASIGRFDIVTAIEPVVQGAQVLAGFVAVSVTDIMKMFRRSAADSASSRLKRIRPLDQDEWVLVLEASDPIEVTLEDLLLMAEDVRRFEMHCDLLRRPTSNLNSSTGYDWEGMYISQMVRMHEQGLPATQAEWVSEVQSWFVHTSENGEVPDERTIRRRLTPIWKALRETG